MKTNSYDTTLEDFGMINEMEKSCEKLRAATPGMPLPDEEEKHLSVNTQWASAFGREDVFVPVGRTQGKLDAGMYEPFVAHGVVSLRKVAIKTDALIELPDGTPKQICDEITDFWTKEKIFKTYGFLHRRGYLLYGPAGSGKTAIVQLVAASCIENGNLVLLCKSACNSVLSALAMIREVEPSRKLVCVFEDIDTIIQSGGEENLLNILDGDNQLDHVLNIATTNYPERLDRRIIARPRRFDRVMKIDMPSAETRSVYLHKKLKIDEKELKVWIEKTSGLSFAALAEAVISVKCLGNTLEDTVTLLRRMSMQTATSEEYNNRKSVGFDSEPPRALVNLPAVGSGSMCSE